MIRVGCRLSLVGLLGVPLSVLGGGNALLVPAPEVSRCVLDDHSTVSADVLQACQQAATGGDAQAAYELGRFYYDGRHTPREASNALHWFEQASLKGHAQAQYRLGLMFFRGEGVPANNVQAYIVLKMAAINGDEEALDAADRVAASMRRDELEAATQVLSQIFHNYLLELQTTEDHP